MRPDHSSNPSTASSTACGWTVNNCQPGAFHHCWLNNDAVAPLYIAHVNSTPCHVYRETHQDRFCGDLMSRGTPWTGCGGESILSCGSNSAQPVRPRQQRSHAPLHLPPAHSVLVRQPRTWQDGDVGPGVSPPLPRPNPGPGGEAPSSSWPASRLRYRGASASPNPHGPNRGNRHSRKRPMQGGPKRNRQALRRRKQRLSPVFAGWSCFDLSRRVALTPSPYSAHPLP